MQPFQQILTDQIETIQTVQQMGAMGAMQAPAPLMAPNMLPPHLAGIAQQMGGFCGAGCGGAAPADSAGGCRQAGFAQGQAGAGWQQQERVQGAGGAGSADPRSHDPRAQAADPRAQASADTRQAAGQVPSADPRRAQAADPRMAAAADPRQAVDPRGARRDPRSADPRDRAVERDRERSYH